MLRTTSLPVPAAALCLVLFTACDSTGPAYGPPAALDALAGQAQADTVGAVLADSLVVHVTDSEGRSVEKAVVLWSTEAGRLSPTRDTTDAEGKAAVRWTLGTTAGEREAVARVDGIDDGLLFRATVRAGAPVRFSVTGGEEQEGEVGTALEDRLTVLITDRHGNPVEGVPVAWETDSDGFPASPDTATAADGTAGSYWMLPTSAGEVEMRVLALGDTVRIPARALSAAPAEAHVTGGDGQEAPGGETLADTLVVRVTDRFGNPVSGVDVVWSVVEGGGHLTQTVDSTDVDGRARALWTIGAEGPQRAQAVAGPFTLPFAATVDSCDLSDPDSDNDRLPDCAESGTNVYRAWYDAGTDPTDPDTDGDGIPDGDEVLGTADGLDLPGLGVSPLRKDLLLEHDWVEDGLVCDPHSHKPPQGALDAVTTMFAEAPVPNPDGSTGVRVLHDVGQGGLLAGGGLIDDEDGRLVGGVLNSDYRGYMDTEMAADRQEYFHYILHVHQYGDADNSSSGQATLAGNRVIVSLGCAATHPQFVANTLAHEVGHNLTLRHGGDERVNYKPNYNSVMNYAYQFGGVDTDCAVDENGRLADGLLAFSTGERPDLDESALDETAGLCAGGPAVDWNEDGDTTDTDIAVDLNGTDPENPQYSVLRDHNDWARVGFWGAVRWLRGADPFMAATRSEPEVTDCPAPPPLQ